MVKYRYLIPLFTLLLHLNIFESNAQTSELLKNLKITNSDEKRLELLMELTGINIYVNTDSAFITLNEAQLLANRLYDKNKLAELDIMESELLCLNGRFDLALTYAKNAKNKAEELNNKKILGRSYLAIANVYLSLNDYEAAYKYCLSAEKILEKSKDDNGLRKCYAYMGSIYHRSGELNKANLFFSKALNYAQKIKNNIFIAMAYNNLAILAYKTGDLDTGNKYIDIAIKLCKKNNYNVLLSTIYINIANLLLNTDKIDEALNYCQLSLDIATRFNLNKNMMRATMMTGIYYYSEKDYDKALKTILRTFELSQLTKDYNETLIASEILSDCYTKKNRKDSSIFYLQWALKYKDSINIRNNANNLTKLQYEYENREQLQEAKFKIVKIGIVIIIFIALLILIIVVYIFKARRKQLKILELEMKSAKIEEELDYRNRELTSKLMYINSNSAAIESAISKLQKMKETQKSAKVAECDEIINELKNILNNSGFKEFELRFNEVHPEFTKRLSEKFPNLTSNEKNLCAYLKLNMSTKDIATLLHVSVNAVIIARYRLRKKLNLNNTDISINKFLEEY